MPADASPTILLASASACLVSTVRTALADSGARVETTACAQDALDTLRHPVPPSLVLLDADLPGTNTDQLLAAMPAVDSGRRFPVVLLSARVTPEWLDRLVEGVIDDLIPPAIPPSHWRMRLDLVLRTFRRDRELAHLRETAAFCPLTGLYTRAALLSMLFRETDRVQRMNTTLCLLMFGIDDIARLNARLGSAACDELLPEVVERVRRLLRSYDLFGRVGKWDLVLALPGCSQVNAVSLAERIRVEVFSAPFTAGGATLRLTAGFGIAASDGRSPVIVLRDAERALETARAAGPASIRTRVQFGPSLCADAR